MRDIARTEPDRAVARNRLRSAVRHGYSLTQNWIDTSLASLKTPSAKAIAALSMDSFQWQKNFLR